MVEHWVQSLKNPVGIYHLAGIQRLFFASDIISLCQFVLKQIIHMLQSLESWLMEV